MPSFSNSVGLNSSLVTGIISLVKLMVKSCVKSCKFPLPFGNVAFTVTVPFGIATVWIPVSSLYFCSTNKI